MPDPVHRAISWLHEHTVANGEMVGVSLATGLGLGLATGSGERLALATDHPVGVVAAIEASIGPRWVWWHRETADLLAAGDVGIQRCWDVLTVDRLLHGGWRASVPHAWARTQGLPLDTLPAMGQLGLLDPHPDEGDDPDDPIRPDGHLRPEWTSGGWAVSTDRLAAWAALAVVAAQQQAAMMQSIGAAPQRVRSTAHAESAAELLCAELTVHGLPIDVAEAERIIAASVGPRPPDEDAADAARLARDAAVLAHAPMGVRVDLRNPNDVRAMLRRVGVDVPDTRAWRLEQHRETHPLVEALLTWRKAERIATTYGYRWLAEHVRDGRLRGEWSSSDGAAGRMTASSGLHNLPAELRPAVAAEPGHVFVRADLGQIEPRVLAAVSGDRSLIAATAADDLYQGVATRLGVTREVAKVAVLGAMYGATTGTSAQALSGLEREYPTAMSVLESAAAAGRAGDDVMTIGGRRVRMWTDEALDDSGRGDIDRARRVAAARGRFARNALIQGAAAELFKVWAITVRARSAHLGARIVLCLHDELIVHVDEGAAATTAEVLVEALGEATHRWSPHRDVRFLADVSVIRRWSEVA
jgi:DNA polymerase I